MAVGCETGTSPGPVWSDMGRTPPWDRSGRAGRASNGQWLASITGMPRRATVVGLVFHLGLSLLLATILLDILRDVVPPGLARRIAFNSEGYTAALLLALWIQFARPRLSSRTWEWPVTIAAGLALVAIGYLLFTSELPSRFKTLNETMFALALVIPYVQVRRPVPAPLAIGISAVILGVTVALNRTDFVVLLSETLALLLLAPLALDVVDRGILDERRSTSPRLRYAWYALLVLMPMTFSILFHEEAFSGGLLAEVVRYGVRLHEAFVGILLVQLYFAVGLRRTGRVPDTAEAIERPRPSTSAGRTD